MEIDLERPASDYAPAKGGWFESLGSCDRGSSSFPLKIYPPIIIHLARDRSKNRRLIYSTRIRPMLIIIHTLPPARWIPCFFFLCILVKRSIFILFTRFLRKTWNRSVKFSFLALKYRDKEIRSYIYIYIYSSKVVKFLERSRGGIPLHMIIMKFSR